MSGDGGCLRMAIDTAAHLAMGQRTLPHDPDPGECQALADNLADMLATGNLDNRLVRQAIVALQAMARIGVAPPPLTTEGGITVPPPSPSPAPQ